MTNHLSTARRAVSTTLLILAMAVAQTATAAPTASGKSFDLSANVSLAGIPILTIDPNDVVAFDDLTVTFNDSKLQQNFSVGDPTTAQLVASDLSTATQWLPSDTFLAVGSRATTANVELTAINPNLILDTNAKLLDLKATQIDATAIVTGTCPPPEVLLAKKASRATQNTDIVGDFVFQSEFEIQNLTPTNTSDIPGLEVDVDGTPLLNIPANPAPNTSITIGTIGTLWLNKQSVTGDGIVSLSSTVDGLLLHVDLAIATIHLLVADVNISHTEASITCN
jgi:hypothetical protein